MPEPDASPITIAVSDNTRVSGLLQVPPRATACFVFAHGAGAGMTHPSIAAVAAGLAERGIASLRYQFPYMEKGGKRPDPPPVAHAAVRAAVARGAAAVARIAADRGRQVVRRPHDLAGAGAGAARRRRGLAFLGFPLHPAKRPSRERAQASRRRARSRCCSCRARAMRSPS